MNSISVNRAPLYSSWRAFIIFVLILIFQPGKATFYAFRPSDGWLLFCLFMQLRNGYNKIHPFRNRLLIKNYGLFMGVLAIISTLIQASYAHLYLEISFIAQFFVFLRFLLIFKFVENIINNFEGSDLHKFWRVYTLMGLVILVLSYLEFNDIQAFKPLMVNLYYESPEESINEYLINVDRLCGILGNPNPTAILLVTTLSYPLIKITNKGTLLFDRLIYSAYVLFTVYVLVVYTGSRAAVFIALLMPLIILIVASRRLKDLILVFTVTLLFAAMGAYLYHRFESKIIVQDRITKAVQGGEDFQLSIEGFGKWTNRYELWIDRYNTFKREGNQLAILLGLGYTKAYKDYADNGLFSAYLNNGLIGLILKLFLFYIFIKSGFLRTIRYSVYSEISYLNLAFAFSALALLLLELTIDVIQHYKLGQLFYMFLSISILSLVKSSRQIPHESIS